MKKTKARSIFGNVLFCLGLFTVANWGIPTIEINKHSLERVGNMPSLENNLFIPSGKKLTDVMKYASNARSIARNSAENGWVCIDYTKATYESYLNLCRRDDRKDLENKMRLAYTFRLKGLNEGHSWVEVYDNGKWVPVETTSSEVELKEGLYEADYVSIPGKRIVYPKFSDWGALGIRLQLALPNKVDVKEWKEENFIPVEDK